MSNVYSVGNKTVYPIIYEVNYGQMKSVNCYLFHDGETLTLIDGGFPLEQFNDFFDAKLAEYGFTMDSIDQIILTHHHEDHTGQVNRIVAQHQIPVYAHHLAIERVHFDKAYLHKKRAFFMQLYEEYGCMKLSSKRFEKMAKTLLESEKLKLTVDIQPLYAGDMICGMEVIEVPGHSPDSILLYDPETKWAFVGDIVLKTGTTNALIDFDDNLKLLPTVEQHKQSLHKCRMLDSIMFFAGHQPPFDNYHEVIDKNLARIEKKCAYVVDAVTNGKNRTLEIANVMYGAKLEKEFGLVMSEVIGYLYYAEMQGKIKKTMQDGEWYFDVL